MFVDEGEAVTLRYKLTPAGVYRIVHTRDVPFTSIDITVHGALPITYHEISYRYVIYHGNRTYGDSESSCVHTEPGANKSDRSSVTR